MSSNASLQQFAGLQRRLLQAGVAPACVRRTTEELQDHLEDIRAENGDISLSVALQQLGNMQDIAEQILQRRELRTWLYRYPKIARAYMPVAYFLLLPIAPILAGANNPSLIMRWGAALLMSAAVTAAMLGLMTLSIAVT